MDQSAIADFSKDEHQYAVDHVFLPPKLPQSGDDMQAAARDAQILNAVAKALQYFRLNVDANCIDLVDAAITAINRHRQVRRVSGDVEEHRLRDAFLALEACGGAIPIHVEAQNAGLIITRKNDLVVFESFELSAMNESVMGTAGRLKRHFPASSVAIQMKDFCDRGLQWALAAAIAKLSREEIPDMKSHIVKAGEELIEERNTTDPSMVTDLLASILRGLGSIMEGNRICKHTRDEVLWLSAARPWRRSPLWLFIRVTLQLCFSRDGRSLSLYKELMIVFMAGILQSGKQHNPPSDKLFCMIAKISRRLLKLDPRGRTYQWLSDVHQVLSEHRLVMDHRWKRIIDHFAIDSNTQPLSSGEVQQGRLASYLDLDRILKEFASRKVDEPGKKFKPRQPSFTLDNDTLPSLPQSAGSCSGDEWLHLLIFEHWVAKCLDTWLMHRLTSRGTCGVLYLAVMDYHKLASSLSSGNTEARSIMYLTIMELWVAADKSACRRIPLMTDYDPEVPYRLLQSLILSSKDEMERLHLVEEYLEGRRAGARFSSPSIYSSFGHERSFPVRFFESSQEHQNLRQKIEAKAHQDREKKLTEFRNLQRLHQTVTSRINNATCTYVMITDPRTGQNGQYHSNTCQRCADSKVAKAMKILLHEWPLPASDSMAAAAVFELDVPRTFSDWRDMSLYLLINVFRSDWRDTGVPPTKWNLENHLPSYCNTIGRRVQLWSITKPHKETHRKGIHVSLADEANIMVANGMTYCYRDSAANCLMSEIITTDELPEMLTYKLSEASASLQDFLYRPFHRPNGLSPNQVISMQALCPDSLSLEEYKATASILIGYLIQWPNILVNLYNPVVNFNKLDTNLILRQAGLQAGPPLAGAVCRAGHQQLEDESFSSTFLTGLMVALSRIKENWESCFALSSLISLGARILTFAPSPAVARTCLGFLANCRQVALKWLRDLQNEARLSEDEGQRLRIHDRVFRVALVCVGTFDIDMSRLKSLLADPAEASVMIESAMAIQRTSRPALESEDVFNLIATDRWQRLIFKSHRLLRKAIVRGNSSCLDDAIRSTWADYTSGQAWSTVSTEGDYKFWLVSRAAATQSHSMVLHFNLLTAELYVNGMNLSRLPAKYEDHPSYPTFFGKTVVEVLPTRMPGMHFSARKPYNGYIVDLGMSKSERPELQLTATKGGKTLDLVPSRIFHRILPHDFINDCVHWYDRSTKTVEFRPKNEPWTPSPNNWRLRKEGAFWVLEKGSQTLIIPSSNLGTRIAALLVPLEDKLMTHIIHHSNTGQVDIGLPKLQLDFFLLPDSTKLHSRQFRGMYIDPVQNIGTLIGLQTKLVLRDDRGKHKVLVPNGKPHWIGSGNQHIRVSVKHGTSTKVHPYDVDTLLGRLVDNGDLQSKLILCYYHGLTSHCLPDPLTGSTGTEQSLTILKSAGVRSFQYLSQENIDMLYAIAQLSPKRSHYPARSRLMETTVWDKSLSCLSQHVLYYEIATKILEQAEQSRLFHPDIYVEPKKLDFVDSELHKRHSIRDSVFHLHSFGAESHTTAYDAHYTRKRDGLGLSIASERVFKVSRAIYEGTQTLYEPPSRDFVDDMWQLLLCDQVRGAQDLTLLSNDGIAYDAKWMKDFPSLMRWYWCQLHHILGSPGSRPSKFHVLFCLATMAYSHDCDSQALQVFVLCLNSARVGGIMLPTQWGWDLREAFSIDAGSIKRIAQKHVVSYADSPAFGLLQQAGESAADVEDRRCRTFDKNCSLAVSRLVALLEAQWPCEGPQPPTETVIEEYIRLGRVMEEIRRPWNDWHANHQFREIQVPELQAGGRTLPQASRGPAFVTDTDIFQRPAPEFIEVQDDTSNLLCPRTDERAGSDNVDALIERLMEVANQLLDKKYAQDLEESAGALKTRKPQDSIKCPEDASLDKILHDHLEKCRSQLRIIYETLVSATDPEVPVPSTSEVSSRQVGAKSLAPRTSRNFFLRQLAGDRWRPLTEQWKKAINAFAKAVTALQRAERMVKLVDNPRDLHKELLNPGHTTWRSIEYPESLLLEVESGIMIRANQESIASVMRAPPNNRNAVMQLNMGEGKSSVIVPIVAARIADGRRLVRVIVAKPQAKELHRMLVEKLGGLLNHRIYHLPFTRSLRPTASDIRAVLEMCRECMSTGGVLLMQPEHILSFQLMGIEAQLSGSAQAQDVAQLALETQHFFNLHVRDIVDESDENFSVKFELLYTMGTQRPIELSPERWTLTQRLLTLVAKVVPRVQEQLPASIEVSGVAHGRFPRTRILRTDALKLLLRTLVDELSNVGLPGFPIARLSSEVRNHVVTYISQVDLSSAQIAAVEGSGFYNESTKGPLLLIRGLIAGGLLGYALGQKRWRVNYGLTKDRRPPTRLAVPHRAKDFPTARSEFSHPEIVIILTCLCNYYGGLSDDDLFLAFEHLMQSDQASAEYHEWVRDAPELPESFRRLEGVNTKDKRQATGLVFPCLRYSKSVVDYFLAHIVFSKELREFPQKLSASGWDIARQKIHPTTGFSGTNDSRHTLPLDVQQLDLGDQKHTNALVLEQLLRPENTIAYMLRRTRIVSSDAEALLELVQCQAPSVQVILDVGAQIIELTNIQVAQTWLEMTPVELNKEAVVFFNDFDDLCVIDRQGQVEQLQTSPYAQQLDLPSHFRAAVTLGANVTKDKLVQACMRMRRLGQGQSVVFCVSEEIRSKVCSKASKPAGSDVDVSDVLMWSISETHADIRRGLPLWALQGERFERQRAIWDLCTGPTGIRMPLAQAERFLEDEAQTLEERYKPRQVTYTMGNHPGLPLNPSMPPRLLEIRGRCREFNCLDYRGSTLDEEQERELAPEMEEERQLERPAEAEAEGHWLHPHVRHFAVNGNITLLHKVITPVFQALEGTSAAEHINLEEFLPTNLPTTKDFRRTVRLKGNKLCADSYQRPVQWILSSNLGDVQDRKFLIISPFEAQRLLPLIEKSGKVTLHLYSPRTNMAFPTLDTLDLYAVPALRDDFELPFGLKQMLNLFAGQLYFSTFADYRATCEMLDLAWCPAREGEVVQADGFISRKADGSQSKFSRSPVQFLRVFLGSIRRDRRGFDKTHWGRMLAGEILTEADFA
ncbi:putative very large low complexity protein [Hirsutella rhossiliensis]|uniref:ubiquitinyl hydrolase 1 n=1 Tax=Hirsutella rhossiliensis TaxID=111463 RepID=A0A9P8MLM7_9HYPO|nr:putative very large low complexity protein [Hirsutella rhossiliensis]KAH0957602.1 putative very large low complexity protein [Hirsutella rhossiliensis]